MFRYARIFLVFALFILIIGESEAQRKRGRSVSQAKGKGVVSGIVVDAQTKEILPTTSVRLFSHKDSSLVTGMISNADGSFRINTIKPGNYFLEVTFIGFRGKRIRNIKITPENYEIDLGNVELNLDPKLTEGVTVVAEKPRFEYRIDKKVVNVTEDISNSGGSAVEALQNIPSVEVDIEGNVALRGSSNFTVYIDGRPSVLQGSEALEQIPVSSIESIEIITNPSAKHDPDGMSGIINVILKKDHDIGWNGVVNATAGTFDTYSGNGLLNYTSKKYSFFTSVDYRKRNRSFDGEAGQERYYDDSTKFTNTLLDGSMNHSSYNLRIGGSYSLTDMSSISLSGSLGKREFARNNYHKSARWSSLNLDKAYYQNHGISADDRDYYKINMDFMHNFDKKGHKLTFNVDFSNYAADGDETSEELDATSSWEIIGDSVLKTMSSEEETNKRYYMKLDYELPIGEDGKFEAGIQSRIQRQEEDFLFYDFDNENNDFILNTTYSNTMNYKRDIHSAYVMNSGALYDIYYQLGLRGEYTYSKIGLLDTDEEYLIDRFDLFPTIHFSHNFSDTRQITAGYSRRVRRPRGRDLEPFRSYLDAENIMLGNPDLKPEFTDSYEIGFVNMLGDFTVTLEGYYRYTDELMTRIRTPQDDGVILHTFANMNSEQTYGSEIMINYMPNRNLSLNLFGNFYKFRLDGTVNDEDVDKNLSVWNSGLNGMYKFINNEFRSLALQMNFFYSAPSIRGQDEYKARFDASMGARYDFLDRKASISLNWMNMFNTSRMEFESRTAEIYSYNNFEMQWPAINLSISYRFNNVQRKKEDIDDMDIQEFQGY